MTGEQFARSIDEMFGARSDHDQPVSTDPSAPMSSPMSAPLSASKGPPVKTTPAILIIVNDIPNLVKAKGGAMGAFVDKFAPKMVESKLYTQMSQQISDGMVKQGVNASVQIVNWPQPGATPFVPDNTMRNVGLLAGAFAAVGLFSFLFARSFNQVTRQ